MSGIKNKGRNQTDECLRVERTEADTHVMEKFDASEQHLDEVVRVARERADEVLQAARECADSESESASASCTRARMSEDVRLEEERVREDAALDDEQTTRRRYLAEFLMAERSATDEHLRGERADADRAIDARNELLGTVSHDLRSLLGALALNATVVDRAAPQGAAGDMLRRHAATAQRLVARMTRLVSDLLDVVSIEEGKLAVFPDDVEVASLVGDTLEAFEPIAATKNIKLEADAGLMPIHAKIDGERVLQVLANIVSNAIKFTPSGGRVSIHVGVEKDDLHFAIRDTGTGIPENALKQVFERFRQVSKDRRGLGLGLHISMGIVAAHRGRMWVTSEVGAGSTFHFTLPVVLRTAEIQSRVPSAGTDGTPSS